MMHLEIQVALNFVMSYLYNKLPRRRVNIFGEELEKALKAKFEGHWYPDKPCRGSAFRCLKTSNPVDPVLCIAARESGMDLTDIREHLPQDMSVWIDPGEVSYRIGEKGQIKLLMSEKRGGMFNTASSLASTDDLALELEKEGARAALAMSSGFNPEAQAFKPAVEALATSMSTLRVGSGSPTAPLVSPAAILASPPKPTVTFTTAAFAQTKFGSTKLKNSSKRPNRMSPTEFSHYIKQRAMIQQQQKMKYMNNMGPMGQGMNGMNMAPNSPPHHMRQFPMNNGGNGLFSRPRSLSPLSFNDIGQTSTSPLSYLGDLKSAPVPAGISPFPDTTGLWQAPADLLGGLNSSGSSSGSVSPPPLISLPPLQPAPTDNFGNGNGYGLNGFMDQSGNGNMLGDLDAGYSLGSLANYGGNNSNYQHLLVAN